MEGKMAVTLREHSVKGVARYLIDADLEGEPIHIHISEIGPGERSHPPHRHGGYEAFYMLDGEGTIEIEGETFPIRTNEGMVIDPQKLHGIFNASNARIRYLVILTKS
jgi:mannose-6-phosphate isomerase-like protein (cupin superfamily)